MANDVTAMVVDAALEREAHARLDAWNKAAEKLHTTTQQAEDRKKSFYLTVSKLKDKFLGGRKGNTHTFSWKAYCKARFNLSRQTVDKEIALLEGCKDRAAHLAAEAERLRITRAKPKDAVNPLVQTPRTSGLTKPSESRALVAIKTARTAKLDEDDDPEATFKAIFLLGSKGSIDVAHGALEDLAGKVLTAETLRELDRAACDVIAAWTGVITQITSLKRKS